MYAPALTKLFARVMILSGLGHGDYASIILGKIGAPELQVGKIDYSFSTLIIDHVT